MADIIEDIQSVLAPLAVGGAWYGMNTRQPPSYPFITFMTVISPTNNSFAGASDLQNTRIQIDVIALRVADVELLDRAIRQAMAAAAFGNVRISAFDAYEREVKAFRRVIDYSVWSTD